MSLGKKIGLGIVLVLAAVLIAGAVIAYPYWKLPPHDPEVLEAKYAEYVKAADEIANRPNEDRETYEELEQALRAVFPENKPDLSKLIRNGACPSYHLDNFSEAEEALKTVLAQDERVQKLVEGGFVMQQGRGLDDDTPNFLRARQIAYAYIVDAIRKIREGNSAAATDRLLTVETLADGFLNTPVLIYTMIGVAITGILDNGMVAVLPVLSDTDLARLHDALAQRPQAAKTVVDAMAGEIVWLIESIDSLGAGDNSRKEVEILGRPTKEFKVGSLEWTMANVLGPLGYMKRERVKVLAFGASQMERYRAWLAAEGTDAPHILPDDGLPEGMRHSLVLRLGWPNYDALVDKGRIGGLRTKAVLEAIEMERTMRASGTRGRLELPYDDEQKIVIEKDYGCIVESAEDALENAD